MDKSLETVRQEIARDFLGRAGIHGIGLSRSPEAIRIYLQADAGPEQAAALAEIEQAAAPFPVLVVKDQPPRISAST